MKKVIRTSTGERLKTRLRKKTRIHRKISKQKGLIARLIVYRSNKYLYAQILDDLKSHTLVQANTREKSFEGKGSKKNVEIAKNLGKLIGQRALENKIERVVFDRNGFDYHGKIKAIADGAREAGLHF